MFSGGRERVIGNECVNSHVLTCPLTFTCSNPTKETLKKVQKEMCSKLTIKTPERRQ